MKTKTYSKNRSELPGLLVAVAALSLVGFVSANAPQRGQRGQPQAPPTPRASAPIDLTGYWVSVVTEDWRWRMTTPPKGDYASLPINPAGRQAADAWDPEKDEAAGEQCRSYGAAAIMRVPGRLNISWENDNVLRVDTDAGTQTRLFRFDGAAPTDPPTWQGHSAAQWLVVGRGGRGGAAPNRGGSLKVVTTHLRPGYLRKNGVPYSAKAIVTEYFDRTAEPNGDSWLIVQTIVEDPQYLTQPFITSTHFKKQPDGAGWNPTPCSSR